VVGIVSRADVLKAFARSDEEIKEDVRTQLAREVVTVDPDAIAVTVDDGIVVLAGIVEKESDARALLETVLDIDGVVGIENDLSVHIDEAPADPDSPGYLTDGPQHWAQR
jgi:osmotically-inducible protein OsmY